VSAPPFGAVRMVQVPDVWHADALLGTPAHGRGAAGERRLHWYLEDFAGNLVMRVPDDEVEAVRKLWGFGPADVVAHEEARS
jgi:hypothetical protein